MKTAKEKAKEIVDALPFAVACHRAHLERAIVTALKEQDRDTRHACAEAVIQLPGCHAANDNAIYDHRDELCEAVEVHAAHDACMNVKAV